MKKLVRIGFFTEDYFPSTNGISVAIETTRQALTLLGHEVYIIAPAPNLGYVEKDPQVIRFPAVSGLFYEDYKTSLFFPPAQLRRIKKLNLDIIHLHSPSQIGLFGLYCGRKFKLPIVSTYHTDLYNYIQYYPGSIPAIVALSFIVPLAIGADTSDIASILAAMKPNRRPINWSKNLASKLINQIHAKCSVVISPSIKLADQLNHWGNKTPLKILSSGVDKLESKRRVNIRARYGFAETDIVLLFVGRLAKEKNLDLLIDLMDSLTNEKLAIKLLLVGDNPYRNELEKRSKEQGLDSTVKFSGWVKRTDLGNYYQAADIFVFPSLTDTQGLVLGEAAHAGLPIIMCDGKITEVVKNRVNGLIVHSTVSAFKGAVLKLSKNATMRASFGTAGQQLAEQFTTHKQAEKLLTIYQDLIES